jgi:hypothetical protein
VRKIKHFRNGARLLTPQFASDASGLEPIEELLKSAETNISAAS